jgi:hypothetical protein
MRQRHLESRRPNGGDVGDINWAAEMRKLEREFSGLPPEPSPALVRSQRESERREKELVLQRAQRIGATIRLVLVGALGAGLLGWPYARRCGIGLFGFLGAELVLLAGSAWVMSYTWRARQPRLHTLALGLFLWSLGLAAIELLPRVGYARPDATRPAGAWCAPSAASLGARLGITRT